jgi:hypothetical protein
MRRDHRFVRAVVRLAPVAALEAFLLTASGPALAGGYTLNYMTNFSGCDSSCSGNSSLSYTDDQINQLDSALAGYGHTRLHKFSNSNTWASDLVEDALGGQDNIYSDNGFLFAYSGHGGTGTDGGGQTFRAPFCKKGVSSSCVVQSPNARLGEQTGPYAAIAGQMKYLIWATCFSVDTAPNNQWDQTMRYGTEMIFGYRGTSADSWTTDEVLGDFADAAFGDGDKLKAAWFWAIEDWWVDDTGALVASGVDEADAVWRRANMRASTPRRAPGTIHTWFAWSWHEG